MSFRVLFLLTYSLITIMAQTAAAEECTHPYQLSCWLVVVVLRGALPVVGGTTRRPQQQQSKGSSV